MSRISKIGLSTHRIAVQTGKVADFLENVEFAGRRQREITEMLAGSSCKDGFGGLQRDQPKRDAANLIQVRLVSRSKRI